MSNFPFAELGLYPDDIVHFGSLEPQLPELSGELVPDLWALLKVLHDTRKTATSYYTDGSIATNPRIRGYSESITDFFFFARRFIPELTIDKIILNLYNIHKLTKGITVFFCRDVDKYIIVCSTSVTLCPVKAYGGCSMDVDTSVRTQKIWENHILTLVDGIWRPL